MNVALDIDSSGEGRVRQTIGPENLQKSIGIKDRKLRRTCRTTEVHHTHLLVLVIVVDAEDELSGRQSLGLLVRSGRIDSGIRRLPYSRHTMLQYSNFVITDSQP